MLVLLGLVLVNAAVILYHGDPRDQIDADNETATETATEAASAIEPARQQERAAGAVQLPEARTYDPTYAMRTPGPVARVAVVKLKSGQSAAAALSEAGADGESIGAALASLAGFVDFRRLHPGHKFKARFGHEGELLSADVIRGPADQVRAERGEAGFKARRLEIPIDTVVSAVSGTVDSSLWTALVDVGGEAPRLVHDVVEVFAWEIDFYSQVFPGDTFRLLLEKRYAEGKFVAYGDLLAAEFITAGTPHRAFIHRSPKTNGADTPVAYYDAQGRSMRKQLLKAPLRYGHVTSTFGRRRHPILGYSRAHLGTDYGVPTGTPVWTVGDGRVVKAGWGGGFGKLVEIRHANGWQSQYAHLSKILVKAGQQVKQKQIIGKVGSTGMSTGPHLHYGLKRHGQYVNSLVQKFDPGKALKGAELEAFQRRVAELTPQLERIDVAYAAKEVVAP